LQTGVFWEINFQFWHGRGPILAARNFLEIFSSRICPQKPKFCCKLPRFALKNQNFAANYPDLPSKTKILLQITRICPQKPKFCCKLPGFALKNQNFAANLSAKFDFEKFGKGCCKKILRYRPITTAIWLWVRGGGLLRGHRQFWCNIFGIFVGPPWGTVGSVVAFPVRSNSVVAGFLSWGTFFPV
jgi:hypothetical protein